MAAEFSYRMKNSSAIDANIELPLVNEGESNVTHLRHFTIKFMMKTTRLLLMSLFLMGIGYGNAQELVPSKTTYKPGEDIVLTFSDGPGNAKDWVGIYKEGQTPGDVGATLWFYVDGTDGGSTGKATGSLVFKGSLSVGWYEALLLEDDGYTILASVSFEVKSQSVVSVELSKASYKSDEKISVSFSGGPGNQKDWIAIYKKEEIPGEVTSLRWSYLDGKKSGELVFDELWIGEYNLYFLENDGYNKLASKSFSVEMPVPSFSSPTLEVAQGSQLSFSILGDQISGDNLSKLDAQNAIEDKWGKRKKQLKEERASEINNKSLSLIHI